jgi:hypothetical protein
VEWRLSEYIPPGEFPQDPPGRRSTFSMQSPLFPHPIAPSGPPWTPAQWGEYLTEATGNPVRVTFGRARRQVIQSKGYWDDPTGKPIELRVSAFFSQAPPEILQAVAQWLRSGKRAKAACAELDSWIAEKLRELPPKPAPKRPTGPLETEGTHHDLGPLMEELVGPAPRPTFEYQESDFGALGIPLFSWGRRQKSSARRSLQLGSYAESGHRIRIHPVLDQANVPRLIVRFVLFHELLHAHRAATDPPHEPGSRRTPHDRAFRSREAEYIDYGRACAWQEARIGALIRSARSGKPLGKQRRIFGFQL